MTARQEAGSGAPSGPGGTSSGPGATPEPAPGGPGELGARVRQRRQELRLTQQELAASAGISVPYLAYLEGHPATPTAAALRELATALQTTPEFLRGEATEATPGTKARPMLRTLTPEECYELLAPGGVGRVVFETADGPAVFPVNFAMAGQTVVLRTAADTALAARLDCKVGFEVDRLDEALSQGWSVLIVGHAVHVQKEEQVRRLESRLALQPWAGGARDVYVQITPHRISGRRIGG